MSSVEAVANAMGGRAVLGRGVKSISELSKLIEQGLPKAALRHVAEQAGGRAQAAGIVYRVVPEATYKRRKRLSPAESERTERLARVVAMAESVWGDLEEARDWLNTRHPELDDKTPLEMAFTELGARRVEEVLARLEYGLPA